MSGGFNPFKGGGFGTNFDKLIRQSTWKSPGSVLDALTGDVGVKLGKMVEQPFRTGAGAAARQAQATQEAMAAQNQAMRVMQQNFQKDLTAENVGTVIAGGTAGALDEGDPMKRRRAGQTGGLSSTLGINV